jgi:hypothetical protein
MLDVGGGDGGNKSASGSAPGGAGSPGYVRIEAFDLSTLTFAPLSSLITGFGLPSPPAPPNAPVMQIASIAGVPAPATPAGSFSGSPDIVLPANQPNPVSVVITASNVPLSTSITVNFKNSSGSSDSTHAGPLFGTVASSTATASIGLFSGTNVVSATATIVLSADAKPLFINGEQVEKIELAATYGGGSNVTYITHAGHRIHTFR